LQKQRGQIAADQAANLAAAEAGRQANPAHIPRALNSQPNNGISLGVFQEYGRYPVKL